MSRIKSIIKAWLPPAILSLFRDFRANGIRFEGGYVTWEEAASKCTGYDDKSILGKVLSATLKVKSGDAAFERDSVIFDRVEYVWPVTAGLMLAAAQCGGRLNVLDFGGALGSSYFQNRTFLSGLLEVRWSVVEQDHYVNAGCEYVQDKALKFYSSLENCLSENKPNVILLSAVLQYLPKPLAILNTLLDMKVEYLIIDRTPFLNSEAPSVIKVQSVPASIYSASYPCWFFEMAKVRDFIGNSGYQELETFESLDKLSPLATWRGFIFKRVIQK